jgi:hypothetical protein
MRMMIGLRRLLAISATLAVAACETAGPSTGPDAVGRAQVTRFFLAPAIARATVFVEAQDPRMGTGPRFDLIRGAVEDNLRAAGFRPVPGRDAAELIAVTDLRRAVRPRPAGESGSHGSFGFGAGGGSGRGGIGGGVGLSFPIGKHREVNRDLAVDTLSIQLRRKSDATNEWEGRAVSEVPVQASGDPADRAFFLARALLSDFPGTTGVTSPYPPRRR